ncbi:hypothetical protein Tsubulata_002223 [Turnera subulata]|uniref:BHLH domain-containing protein n=1 Tax=Turnera subulata TaxID=218843 RepID=A0A9Q0J3E5_9ROSI|nr:hypothetical protein Tsubulata_002223 [Turnera subulata]
MQSGRQFHSQEALSPHKNQAGNGYMHMPVPPSFASTLPPVAKHLAPVHGIEFQPSEVCPKNFIIFDQTDQRSQIMYHPAIANKFHGTGLNFHSTYIQENVENGYANAVERETSSSLKEDPDDIDALLSSEEEEGDEEDEYDEEEVSTARTYGNYGSNSPDSCSNYHSKPRKKGSSSSSTQKSSGCDSNCNSERKRLKMKKMVKALRGIVPGGDEMNTVTVLDEAVRYLKSLKVEVQKLGVTNLRS